ncbi:ANTAR domain-containing protein [Alteromonadaceae bacterium BrNp21-10]|nr:ANTAR domain-containing protein [Alteromonadaceae bacterium BrNp21-10]
MSIGPTSVNKQANAHEPSTVLMMDAEPSRSSALKRALLENGYQIVNHLACATQLLEQVALLTPDVVVISTDTADDETLARLQQLSIENPHPIVMFAERDAPNVVRNTIKAGVSAYIVDDLQPQRLTSIISIAYARFNEYQALRKELEQTKTQLENRKLLDRAKGILMQHKGLSESDAYNTLRKSAMNKGQTMANVAEKIIDAYELLA